MNSPLLELLRCPRCRGTLAGTGLPLARASCSCCGKEFQVARGALRLAGSAGDYTESFGRQWNRYDVARPAEDDAVFRVKTGVTADSLAGKLVLDAGCGGGRYARLAAQAGARVIGVDLSTAVEKAATLCAPYPNSLIAQADLLNLPVEERVFDMVYSIGVLHHTPAPRVAFSQVARCVRPGGRLSVWLYRQNTPPQEWINSALRALAGRLSPRLLENLCAGLGLVGSVPVINRTLNKVVNFSNHPDWTLRVCDNFDWYAPAYQSHHTVEELKRWFHEEGFADPVELAPEKSGPVYDWAHRHGLIIGGGVNLTALRGTTAHA